MNILFVSEEYGKLTKGLYRVWSRLLAAAAHDHSVDLLLNKEHWLHGEISELHAISGTVIKFPLLMPQSLASRIRSVGHHRLLAGVLRFTLRSLLSFVYAPFFVLWVGLLFKRRQTDVVVCHHGGWPAGVFVRWVIFGAKLARVKQCILVIHSFPVEYLKPIRRLQRVEEWAIGRCVSEIVTVSHAAAAALAQRNFQKNIRVIHNGIDTMPAEQGLPPVRGKSCPVIGYLGALVPDKGVQVLLDAALIVDAACRVELMGPADEDYLQGLKSHAANHVHDIVFLGACDDPHPFLERIDFLVVPSIRFESFGMVVLEAMFHRKPVICSDFGGMKEIVVDGETGLIVPAGNSHALSQAIMVLMGDNQLCRKMGEAGYARLTTSFTANRMTVEHLALLK